MFIKVAYLQTKLIDKFESTQDINGLLPELPGISGGHMPCYHGELIVFAGKILFGRSQVHQVAEKRRGKIEEFCQVRTYLANVSQHMEWAGLPPCQGFTSYKTRSLVPRPSFIHR